MIKTMRQIVLEAAFESLIRNSGVRTASTNELCISPRTLRNYIRELQRKGYVIPKPRDGKWIQDMKTELEEFRSGKRRVPEAVKNFCSKCGRVEEKTP